MELEIRIHSALLCRPAIYRRVMMAINPNKLPALPSFIKIEMRAALWVYSQ
jgi:hypothetical protein